MRSRRRELGRAELAVLRVLEATHVTGAAPGRVRFASRASPLIRRTLPLRTAWMSSPTRATAPFPPWMRAARVVWPTFGS